MILVHLGIDTSRINPYISNTLLSHMEATLSKGEKVLLYLNKRGQFSSIVCNDCQHLFQCKNCDTSLSVHKYPPSLRCHLCSHTENIPLQCNKCGGVDLKHIGVGTQQIEESLKKYFQKQSYSVFRFDTDSMKTKKSKQEALEQLNTSDIIIGTKMITTGFNFSKVGLIGVILIEQELQVPQYNTEESVFTNIKQLIGRGSRVGQHTDFVIQSFIPDNDIVQAIVYNNYKEFFLQTLEERKLFKYPPFGELATLEYRHTNKEKALNFITQMHNKLSLELEQYKDNIDILFNPSPLKKYNQYHYKIVIKGHNLRNLLQIIQPEILRNSGLSIRFD